MSSPLPEFKITGSLPASPGIRRCCLLADEIPTISLGESPIKAKNNLIGRENLTDKRFPHKSNVGGELSGLIYTCAAGFLDLGHMRDLIDLTRYYYLQLYKHNAPGESFEISSEYVGEVKVLNYIPRDKLISVARCIAYDQSAFHEIETYWVGSPGNHNSSFSPEDLPSNWFGTYVGEKALEAQAAKDPFDTGATNALKRLLIALGALSLDGTRNAFKAIEGKWVATGLIEKLNIHYLKRRNISIETIVLWKIKNLADCAGAGGIWPGDLSLKFPEENRAYYRISFKAPTYHKIARPDPFFGNMGLLSNTITSETFTTELENIRAHAKAKYGAEFDKQP